MPRTAYVFPAKFAGMLLVLTTCLSLAPTAPALAQGDIRHIDLFESGTLGYYAFRIPSLAISNEGTMLAFAEGRYNSLSDRTISELVLRRSEDGGQTWDDVRVIAPALGVNNYTNASPIVDRTTGQIIVPFIENRDKVYVVKSDDDGLTWSAPQDITAQAKSAGWGFYATGPGQSLQLENGRIIIPSYHRNDYNLNSPSYAHSLYSDDHGQTWQVGGTVNQANTNEASAIELMNGDVAMFMRNAGGNLPRYKSTSADGGETWSAASMAIGLGSIEVDGSIARLSNNVDDDANRILFSTPMGGNRSKLTVFTSYDETATWGGSKVITWGRAAYSDLAISQDKTINLLYENGRQNTSGYDHLYQKVTLAQFDQAWLEDDSDYYALWDFNEGLPGGNASNIDGRIRDTSGYSMHGQAVASPLYVDGQGQYGSAMRFTDSPDRVFIDQQDTTDFFNFFGSDSFTIEAMIRTTNHGAGGFNGAGILAANGNSLSAAHWFFQVEDGGLRFTVRDTQGNTQTVVAGSGLTDGEWNRVAATRDGPGNKLYLYLNGVLVGTIDDPTRNVFNLDDVFIGEFADLSRSFVGDMDFLRFTRGLYVPYVVPEPSTCVLLATGLLGLGAFARRRRNARGGG